MSTSLRLESISKRYSEAFSLQINDLCVQEGEFFSLLGPSGCGKTTMLRLIAGLLQPDQGEIWLGSEPITQIPAERRGFGMVFQQPLLFPHMTVEDNVAFGLKMKGMPKKERLEITHKMLEAMGLVDYAKRQPIKLSGGQLQRVSLARALVGRPKLLLMDEPFSALDPQTREEMRELVKKIHQDYKVTVLFVTHDRDEAFLLSDRIGVMKEGRMLQTGSPRKLYEQPIHPYVALALGVQNIWKGELRDGCFYIKDKDMKIEISDTDERPNQRGWLILRPETLRLLDPEDHYDSSLEGTVQQVSFRQGFYHIKLMVASCILYLIEKVEKNHAILIGQQLRVGYDRDKTQFLPDHTA